MEIVTYPADILRQKMERVLDITPEVVQWTQEMVQTMILSKGIGLAAPQVGLEFTLFVVQVESQAPLVFINPEITATSLETCGYEEGCLSIPGVYGEVIRPEQISIQAWNTKGRPFKMDVDGILARVIQHEMDHLFGVLFFDHMSEFKRERLLKTYSKKLKQ